jgi:hypothetical protein
MYPGLSDADCQVAAFRYQQMVNEGQRQQISADAHPSSGVSRFVFGSVRRQVGALLVSVGQRLHGVQAITNECLVPTLTGEEGAIA